MHNETNDRYITSQSGSILDRKTNCFLTESEIEKINPYETLDRALAQQQPDAELLEALKSITIIIITRKIIIYFVN